MVATESGASQETLNSQSRDVSPPPMTWVSAPEGKVAWTVRKTLVIAIPVALLVGILIGVLVSA